MDEIQPESADFLIPNLLLEHSLGENDFCMNNTVRANYFTYLKKILRANASVHDIKLTQVQCYAQQIEICALRKSLNSTVYREEMLKGIKTLKLCHEMNVPFTHLSLDEYSGAINIQNNNNRSSPVDSFNNNGNASPAPEMPSSTTLKVENTDDDDDDMKKNPSLISSTSNLDVVADDDAGPPAAASQPNMKVECQQNVETFTHDPIYQELEKMFTDDKETIFNSPRSTSTADNDYLNNEHIWRCEYKIHKSSYLQQMYAIYVMNPEKYKRLEEQMKEIFGESSDDDDDGSAKDVPMQDLLRSLKAKVAHIVKHNLMPYYSIKRIRTSEVYKMVAKAVTDRIVDFDPYMSFNTVKKVIKYCFSCRIRNIDAKNVKHCIKIIIWAIEHHFNF